MIHSRFSIYSHLDLIFLGISLGYLVVGCIPQNHSSIIESDYRHPLDPLGEEEILNITDILRSNGKVNNQTRFGLMELAQPDKSFLQNNMDSAIADRVGYALLYDWSSATAMEATVHLTGKRIVSFDTLDTNDPPIAYLTVMRLKEIVYEDSTFLQIMEDIGIDDIGRMGITPYLDAGEKLPVVGGDQVVGALVYINGKRKIRDREYGLTLQVNLTRGKIIEYDRLETYDSREGTSLFSADSSRPDLKPLSITQPEGPGYTIEGSKLTWQNWEIHFGLNPRRALEIYDVSYFDGKEKRDVLFQASAAEMVTPYGDPNWITWFPIDAGNFNLATYGIQTIEEGEDAPPNAVLLDGVLHDSKGQPKTVHNVIAVFERDGGLLWRHYNEARRARDLVLSSSVMIDNYDYVLSWIFHQNGTIDLELLLTGMINYYVSERREVTSLDSAGKIHRILVGPYVEGPIHQHFINFRIDMDVDGPMNNIGEMNSYGEHHLSGDPADEWFYTKEEPLTSELQAKRTVNVMTSRWWKVSNPNRLTDLGYTPSYGLMPMGNAFPYAGIESVVRKKMRFLDAHLWVTPRRKEEIYPAGIPMNPDFSGEGLPVWTKSDRSLINQDLVLWYTVTVTHLPRPEDWPYMPVHRAGFKLVPFGFFDKNPTMDMPKPHPWN